MPLLFRAKLLMKSKHHSATGGLKCKQMLLLNELPLLNHWLSVLPSKEEDEATSHAVDAGCQFAVCK